MKPHEFNKEDNDLRGPKGSLFCGWLVDNIVYLNFLYVFCAVVVHEAFSRKYEDSAHGWRAGSIWKS